METILIAVTVVSVAAAVAALTAVLRMQRSERQRSEARVAALAAAADTHGVADGGWKQVAGEWQWVASGSAPAEVAGSFAAAHPVRFEEVRIKPEQAPSTRTATKPVIESDHETAPAIAFGTVERGEATTGRLPLFAAAVLILVLGSAMLFLRSSSQDGGTTAAQAAAHNVDPLELVSLGHNREAKSLTISGTVRNPATGHKLEGLTAVVSLLDNKGGLISTKDVPLDYRALAPGEEAPFTVSVPDPEAIARYRVSFRAGSEVVPHVDRRSETKLASALTQ
jgi:type II secretory pathway pseudopilin PulG